MTKPVNSRSITGRFKDFLKARAKRRLNEPKDLFADTLLHRACYKNDLEKVRVLLKKSADPNVANLVGNTPLHYACMHGYDAIVRLLLDAGADPTITNLDSVTPLDCAINLPEDNSAREEILDLFRQCAPEMVMEAYCTVGPGA